jgi:hypothetical protein
VILCFVYGRIFVFIEMYERVGVFLSIVEQELLIFPKHLSPLRFFVGFVLLDLWFSVCCFAGRCFSFSCWSFYCLSFDLRILNTLLVSSNSFSMQLWNILYNANKNSYSKIILICCLKTSSDHYVNFIHDEDLFLNNNHCSCKL